MLTASIDSIFNFSVSFIKQELFNSYVIVKDSTYDIAQIAAVDWLPLSCLHGMNTFGLFNYKVKNSPYNIV